MSGDVQPRKRKDKRRKKDVSNAPAEYRAEKTKVVLEDLHVSEDAGSSVFSSDETIHVHKDSGTGGNVCAKIVFFLLLGALAVMVGLIVTEYRGSSDVDTPVAESRWAQVFDGWVDESPSKHEHDEPVEESGEHDEEPSEETEGPGEDEHEEREEVDSQEEEEAESEEAQSPEEEEEEESKERQEEEEEAETEEQDEEEEEEETEEQEEEEEEEEQESSEELLEGIPGVTESDEDDRDEEGDGESGGVSEEATGGDEQDDPEDSGEADGDKDDDEAEEEAAEEEVEGDEESGHDDDDEPSGVALKFGVGVALVLVAHVVLVRKWNADDGTTVQPAVPVQASDAEHGVEEITPELIERRQTLIPQDDLEDLGSEYSEEEEEEEEEEEREEDYDDEEEDEKEKPQKIEMYEDYMTKYRPQTLTEREPAEEVKRVVPADSEENSDEEEEEEEESEEDKEPTRMTGTSLQKSARASHITAEESGTEEEGSEEEEVVPVRRAAKSSGEQGYVRNDITSKEDLRIRERLDLADAQLEEDFDD